MRLLNVPDSETIEAVGYERAAGESGGTLGVVFKASPDVIYRYEGVSPEILASLVSSHSIGKTFHDGFRKTKHPFTKSARETPTLKK